MEKKQIPITIKCQKKTLNSFVCWWFWLILFLGLVKIFIPKYFYKNVNTSLKKKISYYSIVDVENSDEEKCDKKNSDKEDSSEEDPDEEILEKIQIKI